MPTAQSASSTYRKGGREGVVAGGESTERRERVRQRKYDEGEDFDKAGKRRWREEVKKVTSSQEEAAMIRITY